MLHSEGFTCTSNVDKAQILNTSVLTHDNDSPVSYLGFSPFILTFHYLKHLLKEYTP